MDHTVLPANYITPAFPSKAFTGWRLHWMWWQTSIAAHYSFIDQRGWKAELAWLVELYRTAYPCKWSPNSYKSSTGRSWSSVQAVSPQVTYFHPPSSRLPLFPPSLQSPTQPKNVTVLWPEPSYTAWWQRHKGVNNLPKVVMQLCPSGIKPTTYWSQVQCLTATPLHHITLVRKKSPWTFRRFSLKFATMLVKNAAVILRLYSCKCIISCWKYYKYSLLFAAMKTAWSLTVCSWPLPRWNSTLLQTSSDRYFSLSLSSITWYWSKDSDVLRLERWPQAWRKVMAAYRWWWC